MVSWWLSVWCRLFVALLGALPWAGPAAAVPGRRRRARMGAVRVLIAPDSFKGTLPATGVARALAGGWRAVRPADTVVELPLADGGEGTLDAVNAAVPQAVLHRLAPVTGPDGRPVPAAWVELPDGRAVVELATSSGLPLMAAPDPLGAHTSGLGEVLLAAVARAGVRAVSIAVGGSASTDGGTGALAALGAVFLDGAGRQLPPGGAALRQLARVELAGLRPAPPGGVEVLADVTTPLRDAAAVFGPQKGAGPAEIAILTQALDRLAAVLGGAPDAPGTGAAGGTSYGFMTLWGARIVPGAARIAELAGLAAAVEAADLVLTGEGRLDRTSLAGKVPGYVARVAAAAGRECVAVTGQADPAAGWPGARLLTLAGLAGSAAAAMADPHRWLVAAGRQLAADRRGRAG
jgi:glycerate 2-kinase